MIASKMSLQFEFQSHSCIEMKEHGSKAFIQHLFLD